MPRETGPGETPEHRRIKGAPRGTPKETDKTLFSKLTVSFSDLLLSLALPIAGFYIGAKIVSAIFKVKEFSLHVWLAMPPLVGFSFVLARAICALFVGGKGTYDKMTHPALGEIHHPKTSDMAFERYWIALEKHALRKIKDPHTKFFLLMNNYRHRTRRTSPEAQTHFIKHLKEECDTSLNAWYALHPKKTTQTLDACLQQEFSHETLDEHAGSIPALLQPDQMRRYRHVRQKIYNELKKLDKRFSFVLSINDRLEETRTQLTTFSKGSMLTDRPGADNELENIETNRIRRVNADVRSGLTADETKKLREFYRQRRADTYRKQLQHFEGKDRQNYAAIHRYLQIATAKELAYLNKLQGTLSPNLVRDCLKNQEDFISGGLEQHAGKWEKRSERFANFIGNVNATVFSSLAGYAMFTLIAGLFPGLFIPLLAASFMAIITAFVSVHFGKTGIKRSFKAFGAYFDNYDLKDGATRQHSALKTVLFVVTLGSASVVSAPLLYIGVHIPLLALLGLLGCSLVVAAPIACFVAALLVGIASIASVGLLSSQANKIGSVFHELMGKESTLYKESMATGQQYFYYFTIFLGFLAAGATVAISVVGDMFGVTKVFSTSIFAEQAFLWIIAGTSLIYNTVWNLADTVRNVVVLFCGGKEQVEPVPVQQGALPTTSHGRIMTAGVGTTHQPGGPSKRVEGTGPTPGALAARSWDNLYSQDQPVLPPAGVYLPPPTNGSTAEGLL